MRGRLLTSDQVWELWDHDSRRAANCFRFDAERYLDPHGEFGEWCNHSCVPNASVHVERRRLHLRALAPIAVGEEITHDYSTLLGADDEWTMRCKCGEPACRRRVSSIDALPTATIREYRKRRMIPAHILATLAPQRDPVSDRSKRCPWCGDDPLYVRYHDTEWGIPVTNDRALFEKLLLDGFQAGLSWITILKKRAAFQRAFHHFDPERIARYGPRDRARLLADASIVRSAQKIDAAVSNARAFLAVRDQEGVGGFRDLLWASVGHATRVNHRRRMRDVPVATRESEAMSRALRAAVFSFCGPTICYAFMQAVGMVNDHLIACPRHAACEQRARVR